VTLMTLEPPSSEISIVLRRASRMVHVNTPQLLDDSPSGLVDFESLMFGAEFRKVRGLLCLDYPAMHSILSLDPNDYLYISKSKQSITWSLDDDRIVAASHSGPNCLTVDVFVPRSVTDFKQPVRKIFASSRFSIPLALCYLDYEVHLQKALVQNIILLIARTAVSQHELAHDAFTQFDMRSAY